MRCALCRSENLPEASYCEQCGTTLEPKSESHPTENPTTKRCDRCAKHSPIDSQFCGSCGMQFEPELTAISPIPPSNPSPDSPWEYMGFWVRLVATVIDLIIVGGAQFILGWVFTGLGSDLVLFSMGYLYSILFVGYRGQTIGKMALGIQVVDTYGNIPGLGRAALRETIGKFLSGILLFLGYLWVAWEERKRGLHDYIATTYVIKK